MSVIRVLLLVLSSGAAALSFHRAQHGAPGDFLVRPVLQQSHSLAFLSVGDWGLKGHALRLIASQMGSMAALKHAQFALLLGDNFYEDGVSSDTDEQWQSTYNDVFVADSLHIPFYAVRGNHDMHEDPDAEIAYYRNHRDDRWFMPAGNYTITMPICEESMGPRGGSVSGCGTVQIVFIDTPTLAPEMNEDEVRVPDNVHEIARTQLQWVEETLNASTADWLLVVGHYPMYSRGEHGDSKELIGKLEELLVRYRVDAYISGHDHTLQHLQKHGVHYFVNGNAVKMGYLYANSQAQTVWDKVCRGFMVHEVSRENMTTTMIDTEGRTLYSFSQQAWRNHVNGSPTLAVPQDVGRGSTYGLNAWSRTLLIAMTAVSTVVAVVGLVAWRMLRRRAMYYRNLPHSTPEAEANDEGVFLQELV